MEGLVSTRVVSAASALPRQSCANPTEGGPDAANTAAVQPRLGSKNKIEYNAKRTNQDSSLWQYGVGTKVGIMSQPYIQPFPSSFSASHSIRSPPSMLQ